ncbi:hypothetical protein Tsubulata_015505 [Turnera subulata]|uniref:Uncharacterized protein n=1 Tax=Turnera subulata TaxID=218843 RepID=A0A9Q0GAT3_9ROSI|nr:hypothetical protein Tsubulata_015505 [Turnera subulata]
MRSQKPKRPKPHTLKNHSNLPHSIGDKDTTSVNVLRSEVDGGKFWQMGLDPLYLQNLEVIGIYRNLGEALRQICEDVAMISTKGKAGIGTSWRRGFKSEDPARRVMVILQKLEDDIGAGQYTSFGEMELQLKLGVPHSLQQPLGIERVKSVFP